ncbi:MAG: DNA primase [Erysipelotrichales bacterium]
MKRVDEATIEEIKKNNDIVDVLSDYVSLIKKGKNYVCLCPFHDDSNPSMVVSQEKQIYKCFSCDAGGNVISFVQNFEQISFVEALSKLASKVGIELGIDTSTPVQENKNKEYYDLNKEALTLYEYLIKQSNESLVKDYLEDRKIDDKVQERFKIGFAPIKNVLSDLFTSKELDLNKAVEIGLLRVNNNEYIDVYKNRIIYPIIDIYDNVLGYTARALGNVEPKYINAIESKVFDKSSILYNINNAKDEIKKTKRVYVLEGAHDVIAFDKVGYQNAVCVMGTALTNNHIALLRRVGAQEIVLGFDGDDAGQKATYHAIELLSKTNLSIKYIDFNNDDPDDYLKKEGYEKFKKLVDKPLSATEFRINYEFKKINTSNYDEKKKVVQKLVLSLNESLDEFDKEYYYNYLANISGISFDLINSFAYQKASVDKPRFNQSIKPKVRNTMSDIENAAINTLFFIMNDHKYFEIFNNEVGTFIDSRYRKMYNIIAAHYLGNTVFDISLLDSEVIDNDILRELMDILLMYDYTMYNDENIFFDSLATIKLEESYLKLETLEKELRAIEEPLHKAKISSEILKLSEYIKNEKKIKFNR